MCVRICWCTCRKWQMWKQMRDENGGRLQWGSSSVIVPEAAPLGTTLHPTLQQLQKFQSSMIFTVKWFKVKWVNKVLHHHTALSWITAVSKYKFICIKNKQNNIKYKSSWRIIRFGMEILQWFCDFICSSCVSHAFYPARGAFIPVIVSSMIYEFW